MIIIRRANEWNWAVMKGFVVIGRFNSINDALKYLSYITLYGQELDSVLDYMREYQFKTV